MKKLVLLYFIFNSSLLFSQKEWAPIGAKWHFDKPDGMMSAAIGYVLIECTKDSIINNKNVRVLTLKYIQPNGDTVKYPNEYTYSESGKVYVWKKKQFHLLYNFNVNKDSTWDIFSADTNPCGKDSSGSVKVDSVRTEVINQQSLKCIYVSPTKSSIWTYRKIIEPFGSIDYLFPLPVFCGISDDFPFASPLRCYEDTHIGLISFTTNKACNYITTGLPVLSSKSIKVYPNPIHDQITIEFNGLLEGNAEILIVDVNGSIRYSKENIGVVEKIDLGNLATGIYLIKIMQKNHLIYLNKLCKI